MFFSKASRLEDKMRSFHKTLALASLGLCFGMSLVGTGCGDGKSESGGMDAMDTTMDEMDDKTDDGKGKTGKDKDSGSSTDEDTTDGSKKKSVQPKMGSIDCSKLKPESGNEMGKVGPEVKLTGADGQEYNLHDYCNSVVVLAMGIAS